MRMTHIRCVKTNRARESCQRWVMMLREAANIFEHIELQDRVDVIRVASGRHSCTMTATGRRPEIGSNFQDIEKGKSARSTGPIVGMD